jgi:hypothetical protein
MKKVLLFMYLVFCISNYAQPNISNISLKLGTTRNYQGQFDNVDYKKNALFTEFEVGGRYFIGYFDWRLSFGYFDEKINQPVPVADYETISHKNYTIGLRLLYDAWKVFNNSTNIKLYIIGGVNYNIKKGKNISNFLTLTSNFTDYFFQPYIGLQSNYEFLDNITFLIEVGDNIGIDKKNLARYVFLFGIKYKFN